MNVPMDRLARLVQDWYESKIRRVEIADTGEDPGEWTLSSITAHFYHHMLDFGLQQKRSIDTFRTIREKLLSLVIVEHDDGHQEVDSKVLAALVKVDESLMRVFTTATHKGVNYNPDLAAPSGNVMLGKGTALHAPEAEGQRRDKKDTI